MLDVSLRMLHTKKQAPWQRPLVSAFQRLLRETPLGKLFFGAIAKPAVSNAPRPDLAAARIMRLATTKACVWCV